MSAPLPVEWFVSYGPVGVGLLLGCAIERRTGRLPNWLSLCVLLWSVVSRLAIGPLPFWEYGVSFVLAAIVLIGIGFLAGWIGGGGAKLGIATAAVLPMRLGWIFSLEMLAIMGLVAWIGHRSNRRSIPGSIVLLGVYASVLCAATLL